MDIKHLAAPIAAVLSVSSFTASAADVATPSAKAIRSASTYVEVENEPPPKLFVDPPLPDGLAIGVVWCGVDSISR
ncbi:DUF6130 family protein [Paraburkholderia kirstenboschensis]|uniref:DUF6130 family protein n=1 Tax=Paraburkholderia kirstenboschensis TaxID=1245436 RepID=A0ABZ0EDF5_9BURK|nr:DUF6130 family protein [Paraburkholderia kirstenboschensis]WOD14499.1 DUF6130 family protein [Paraburkholderia kirstenboschensis]